MAAPGGSSTLRWITRANALGKCARRHLEPRQSPVGMKWCSAPEKYLALSVPGHAETESTTPIRRCTRVNIAKPPQTVVVFGPNPSLVERHGSAVSSKPIGASYEAIPWSLETLVDTPRELTL